jgi:hypothetical protein
MSDRRKIKQVERELIVFLLKKLGLSETEYPINEFVEEYEGYVMKSIGLGNPDISPYSSDFIQAKYVDSDSKTVMITLTKDQAGQILDLDFWKEDFSSLVTYPKSEDLTFEKEFL